LLSYLFYIFKLSLTSVALPPDDACYRCVTGKSYVAEESVLPVNH